MNTNLAAPFSRRPRSGHRLAVFAAVFLLSVVALAAKVFAHSASHQTKKTPEQVLAVLTAYGQICNKGCKYEGQDVVEFIQLPYKKTETSWFTYTFVSTTMRDVRYFSRVSLTKKEDGSIAMTTRQLEESDKALIAELESKSGRKHDPAFEAGKTTFSIVPVEGGTKVTQAISMTASGMVAMFGSQIEEGMRNGVKGTFRNIEK